MLRSEAIPPNPPFALSTSIDVEKAAYGKGFEAQQVRNELGTFDYQCSRAWASIEYYFGASIRLRELKGIISAITGYLRMRRGVDLPELSRNTKRSVPLMVKYVEMHSEYFLPLFPCVSLADIHKEVIPLLDSQRTLLDLQGRAGDAIAPPLSPE
jgi:hypothetical protein